MAETPSEPPGWPFNQDPNPDPPQPDTPAYEPPPHAPQPAPLVPPAPSPTYQSPYEPPVPSVAPAPPAQPPPPPNWGASGAPAAPVRKSRRSLWVTLAVVFGVFAMAVASCAVWFISTVTAPVDTANEFLAAIDRGDYAQAIALSDPGCSQGMSEADLANAFQGTDIDYNLNSSSIENSNGTVAGSFSAAGQNFSRIEVFLVNNDGWRVCGFDAN